MGEKDGHLNPFTCKKAPPLMEGALYFFAYFLKRKSSGIARARAIGGIAAALHPPPEGVSEDVVKLLESDHSEYAPFESLKRTRQ